MPMTGEMRSCALRQEEEHHGRDHCDGGDNVEGHVKVEQHRIAAVGAADELEGAAADSVAQRHQCLHAEREAEGFERQARLEVGAVAPQHRHAAHGTCRIFGIEAEAAEAGRRIAERREGCDGACGRRQRGRSARRRGV